MAERRFRCSECEYTWEIAYGTPRPHQCPQCKSSNIHRAEEDSGHARVGRRRKGGGYGSSHGRKEA